MVRLRLRLLGIGMGTRVALRRGASTGRDAGEDVGARTSVGAAAGKCVGVELIAYLLAHHNDILFVDDGETALQTKYTVAPTATTKSD